MKASSTETPTIDQSLQQAIAHHKADNLQNAQQRYRAILEADPFHQEASLNLGVLTAQLQQPDGASRTNRKLRRAAEKKAVQSFSKTGHLSQPSESNSDNKVPHPPPSEINQLVALFSQGRYAEAEALSRRMTGRFPGYGLGWKVLGASLSIQGRTTEALAPMQKTAILLPMDAEAHSNLAANLVKLGCLEEAKASLCRVLEIRPESVDAHNNLGNLLKKLGCFGDAAASYRRALETNPFSAEIQSNLGNTLKYLNRMNEAVVSYRFAIELRPDYPEAYNNLGNILYDLDRFAEAEACYRRALAIRPDYADAFSNMSVTLKDSGHLDNAEASCYCALVLQPDSEGSYHNLGNIRKDLGHTEAVSSYRRSLEIRPDYAEAYYNLSAGKKFKTDDPDLLAIEAILKMPGRSIMDLVNLHYAAAKACDDIGVNPEQAFQHYAEGACLKRKTITYDVTTDEKLFAAIAGQFTAELMTALHGSGNPAQTPVFIVGMPRSGTSLIEQILASNPRVYGAGELRELSDIVISLSRAKGVGFPQWVNTISPQELLLIGNSYSERLTGMAPEALRITDKMPANFLYLGLIALALPNARIIHSRRNPVDTCLSCFTQLFSNGQHFSYDLKELGRYYMAYERLMAHWRKVLPQGVMLEVNYEDLVDDLENESRKLVSHCGLEWHPASLDFHKTDRPVQTASATQVRQPIYRSSVEKWRRYEPWLGELLAELKC